MNPDEVQALFTGADGAYLFARWGRPIAPIVFGVEQETLRVVKGACEAVVALAGHDMAETDPELGANLMVFFCRDWDELPGVPDLDRLIDGLGPLVTRLTAEGASQYRVFRFDKDGAIRACFVFLRMSGPMAQIPAETLALDQMVRCILLWSEAAFAERSPLALAGERVILRPEIGAVIRAGYDPAMPAVSREPGHALRLFARIGGDAGSGA